MGDTGAVFKRCGCRNPVTGRRLDRACPRLGEPDHGSWYFACSAPNVFGRAERLRRGGYPSRAAALRAREEWLTQSEEARTGRAWTVQRWLRYWLSTRVSIRPTTRLSHQGYIEQFLIPQLGHLRLADLSTRHLSAAFAQIAMGRNRFGQLHTPSTLHHVRTTLRAALNAAIREGLITDNPARRLELPTRPRPRAVMWTPARVAHWQATGTRPGMAIWTPQQLAAFLHAVRGDRLRALWWLIALRGLRRGEALALRWMDLDLQAREAWICRARTSAGYRVHEGPPKTAAGMRTVALDKKTVVVLRRHNRRQQAEHAAAQAGRPWRELGYVFTRPDGSPLHPDYVSQRFCILVVRAGLPPIRLHDLRHGAATLAHTAGADLKTVQDQLGHASIAVTADLYTNVLPATQHRAAEATARLLRHAADPRRVKIGRKRRRA
jgi:integrase